ncbi:MAG: electron transport protein SCO1/SenC [Bryobacterales bacterium]|nr:electron transport protein SCO1/SenC [Bryobacterales bacterium]
MKYIALWIALAGSVRLLPAQVYGRPPILRDVGIDQKMGAQLPLDLPFEDEHGRAVTLRDYSGKPIILALVYYQCPSLCNLVLNGVSRVTRGLSFAPGKEYEFIAVSFDPRESAPLALAKKHSLMQEFGRPGPENGWHFLTDSGTSAKILADAVGFHYTFDNATNQFAHPSAILILTPEGRVAQYFYGIDYLARDVRLGLVEASRNNIGSPLDQVQLFCFHYDPSNGKYSLAIMNILRGAGLATVAALAGFMLRMFRRDWRPGGG